MGSIVYFLPILSHATNLFYPYPNILQTLLLLAMGFAPWNRDLPPVIPSECAHDPTLKITNYRMQISRLLAALNTTLLG